MLVKQVPLETATPTPHPATYSVHRQRFSMHTGRPLSQLQSLEPQLHTSSVRFWNDPAGSARCALHLLVLLVLQAHHAQIRSHYLLWSNVQARADQSARAHIRRLTHVQAHVPAYLCPARWTVRWTQGSAGFMSAHCARRLSDGLESVLPPSHPHSSITSLRHSLLLDLQSKDGRMHRLPAEE